MVIAIDHRAHLWGWALAAGPAEPAAFGPVPLARRAELRPAPSPTAEPGYAGLLASPDERHLVASPATPDGDAWPWHGPLWLVDLTPAGHPSPAAPICLTRAPADEGEPPDFARLSGHLMVPARRGGKMTVAVWSLPVRPASHPIELTLDGATINAALHPDGSLLGLEVGGDGPVSSVDLWRLDLEDGPQRVLTLEVAPSFLGGELRFAGLGPLLAVVGESGDALAISLDGIGQSAGGCQVARGRAEDGAAVYSIPAVHLGSTPPR